MSRHGARRWLTLSRPRRFRCSPWPRFGPRPRPLTLAPWGWTAGRCRAARRATQTGEQISTPGLRDRLVAARPSGRRRRGRHRGRRARADRPLPGRVLLDQHEARASATRHDRRGHDPRCSRCRGGSGRTSRPIRAAGRYADLIVNGVVGEADVWVNGQEVATAGHRAGRLHALHVRHHQPAAVAGRTRWRSRSIRTTRTTMFTLDNVDWTQIPPDNNTGIQFPIQLHTSGPLALSNAHVVQDDASDLSTAALTLKADVTNHAGTPQTGRLSTTVQSPTGHVDQGQPIGHDRPRRDADDLPSRPSDDPQLLVHHPTVWWPHRDGPTAALQPAHAR